MHILIIAHFAGTPYHGMVYGHYYLAREWIKSGHRVTIIADGYAHTRHRNPELGETLYTREDIDGIQYFWVDSSRYRPSDWSGRVLNILAFSAKTWWCQPQLENVDFVICSSHHPLAFFAAEKIAQKNNAGLVFEVRDIWPLTLVELGGASRCNPLICLMQYAEDRAYRNSSTVVSVLSHAWMHMQSRGMHPEKFVYVPNGIVEDKGQTAPLAEDIVKRLTEIKSKGNRILAYTGRLVLANALDTLIDALNIYHDYLDVLILGDGPMRAELEKMVEERKLQACVHFFDAIDKRQVPAFLEFADIGYMGFMRRPLYRFGVSPTKVNDYMLAGIPVIYASDAPGNQVSEADAGFGCNPGDPRAIADVLRSIANCGEAELKDMGARGRRWVLANRTYPVLAKAFLQAIEAGGT